jgi:hypothetical protein
MAKGYLFVNRKMGAAGSDSKIGIPVAKPLRKRDFQPNLSKDNRYASEVVFDY